MNMIPSQVWPNSPGFWGVLVHPDDIADGKVDINDQDSVDGYAKFDIYAKFDTRAPHIYVTTIFHSAMWRSR